MKHFQYSMSMYYKCEWLASSTELNAGTVYLCVMDRNISWTKTGYRHLGKLVKSIAEHAMT